ncbi:hypothetical protein HMSSN036_46080 [Paenibacillus macerans]|nr:hypothetical protein HMSSN036_46080 [Paenibacillus macerans]
MDTPGIHKRQSKLGDYMNTTALNTLGEVEAVLFLVDVAEGLGGGDRFIIERLKGVGTPVILVLNKSTASSRSSCCRSWRNTASCTSLRKSCRFRPSSATT